MHESHPKRLLSRQLPSGGLVIPRITCVLVRISFPHLHAFSLKNHATWQPGLSLLGRLLTLIILLASLDSKPHRHWMRPRHFVGARGWMCKVHTTVREGMVLGTRVCARSQTIHALRTRCTKEILQNTIGRSTGRENRTQLLSFAGSFGCANDFMVIQVSTQSQRPK